jgi:hypothetical protein
MLLKHQQANSGFGLAFKIVDLMEKGPINENTTAEFLSLYSVAPFCE